jgi:dipeptidyl aminopeptidase/acylaminoacyl peptidase
MARSQAVSGSRAMNEAHACVRNIFRSRRPLSEPIAGPERHGVKVRVRTALRDLLMMRIPEGAGGSNLNCSVALTRGSLRAFVVAWMVVQSGHSCNAFGMPSAEAPRIDISDGAASRERHTMTLAEILSLREIHEPRLSPDGGSIAFTVRQAFLDCNCYRTGLYVIALRTRRAPRKLLERAQILSIQWTPDGSSISYLSEGEGARTQLWRIDVSTAQPAPIVLHLTQGAGDVAGAAVLGYRWSHDGRTIAFTVERPHDVSMRAAETRNGIVFDDGSMTTITTGREDLDAGPVHSIELWSYSLDADQQTRLWSAPESFWSSIGRLAWSPDDTRIAFTYFNSDCGDYSESVAIIDVASREIEEVDSSRGNKFAISWSTDGRRIAFINKLSAGRYATLTVMDPGTKLKQNVVERLWFTVGWFDPSLAWSRDGGKLLFSTSGLGQAQIPLGLYSASIETGHVTRLTPPKEKVSECDSPVDGLAACVHQSPSMPPALATVDLTTGTVTRLTDVNPELQSVELAPVKMLHWKNAFGSEASGYLLLPPHRSPGIALPLLVVAYAFDGDFVAQSSPVHTSYPAQALAAEGFAVLLANFPPFEDWRGRNFARGSVAWGYSPLSTLRVAIDILSAQGIIDRHRVGFMGHSWGGFWVQFSLAHSRLIAAAESHNGGTNVEPESYWVTGNRRAREVQEHFMGGPPFGRTLSNYVEFSPTLNTARMSAPLLLQDSDAEASIDMALYGALRRHSVPVEFVIYPQETHVFSQPIHRMSSMQRTLDWFNFWLRHREPPGVEQSMRWRGLRRQWELRQNSLRNASTMP